MKKCGIFHQLKLGRVLTATVASLLLAFTFAACSGNDDNGGGRSEPKTTSGNGSTVADYEAPAVTGSFYPAAGSTDAFVDTDLYVVYDSNITVNRNATAKITISDGTNTDEIAVKGETYKVDGCNKVTADVKVNKELVIASGKVLVIKPHSILTAGTTYTVTVPEGVVTGQASKTWSFTPKAMNTPAENIITVGTDCATINGALKIAGSDGDWTINVPAGSYHEILGYYGNANVTIVGAAGDYGKASKVFWNNSQALGNSQRTRQSFIWEGGNLTIKNMTFRNTANRAEEGNVNIQAETLYFDCQKDLVVYNSTFSSYQDTILIGNNGGRAWFYKCWVEGDVDFIWGYADVALFENCKIVCLGDGIKNDAKIFASRTVSTSAKTTKGFVLLNSDVIIQNACKAAYGRSSGADTQASVINCTFTTEGTGSLDLGLWGSASDTRRFEPNEEMAVGYKDYGNKLNGKTVTTSSRCANTEEMSDRLVKREYNGRWTILNRYFDEDAGAYKNNASVWDISTYVTEFGAPSEASKENIYVDPVYTKNVIGGNTVQLTPYTTSADTLTYTYVSSDTSIATVDADGLVTAKTGVTGSATITVTGSNGSKDYAVVAVIPTKIDVTGIAVTAPSSVDVYALNKVTAAFTPADATVQSVTWTATGDIKIVDPSTKTLVTTLTTTGNSIDIEGLVANGSGTITAVAVDNDTISDSKTISISAVRDYNAVEGTNVNSKDETAGCGNLNFQSGKVGMWHDMYVHAIYNGTNGKICASGERVQTRYGTMYIPVTANCYIDIQCQKWNDSSLWVTDFTDLAGNSPDTWEDENEETYKYHYKWELDVTNDTAKLKSGADVLALYNDSTKDTNRSWVNHTPDTNAKYFGIVIPGGDRYWTHITITEDANIQHEAASAELSVSSDFAESSVTLDLNGTTSVTQTVTGASSDGATPTVTYSTDNSSAVSVNSSTGEVTAAGIGVATITATVAHPSDSNVTKVTSTYTVLVKDTTVRDSYSINLANVLGANNPGTWDFGNFKASNAASHADVHGWTVKANGSLTVHVTGNSTITIGSCQYGSGNDADIWTVSADSSTLTLTQGEGATTDYVYTGDAADVTFTYTGSKDAYIHSISVTSANAATVYAAAKTYDFRTDDYNTYAGYTVALNGFAMAGGSKHGTTYGWNMKSGNSLTLLVSGSCTITFLGSQHSSLSMVAEASAGSITPSSQTAKVTNDCSDTYVFTYTGTEATLTFTASAVEADGTGSGSDIYLPTVTLAYTE